MRLLSSLIMRGAVAALLAMSTGSAEQHDPPLRQYVNRAEYDLVMSVYREVNPQRKLKLLHEWSAQFPKTMFRQERFQELIVTQQALSQDLEMRRTAGLMAADDPHGLGFYWLTVLTIALQDTSPQELARGKMAANELLRNLPISFSLSNKPFSVDRTAWFRERDRQQALAWRTLGWVALQERNWDEAIGRLTSVLRSNPNDAEASYWVGVALLGTNKAEAQKMALFHFARSLAIRGPGALTAAARALVEPYLKSAYIDLHGSDQGLRQLLAQARTGPFPRL